MAHKFLCFSGLLFCLLFFGMLPNKAEGQALSQTRAQLEQQRSQLQKDIQRVTQDLEDVQASRHRTMTQLRILQNKLQLRNKLIKNINQEIDFINEDIHKANHDIHALQKELDTLRSEYAKLIVYAYKNRSAYNFLNFILSANSFNDAIKRFQYLKQYREYRKHQASSIIQTQQNLKKKLDTLNRMKTKRSSVLASEKRQRENMISEKQKKDSIAQTLKGHEKELLARINAKKKESREVSLKIAAVIRREIEEARRRAAEEARRRAIAEARARAAKEAREGIETGNSSDEEENTAAAPAPTAEPVSRPTNILEATPEAKALSESFEANRGKLPWPVARAIVIGTFGVHPHPVLEKVMVDNDGITLQTAQNATVRAIFKGEVAAVSPISGRWLVVIRHGQYFSVYSNLKNVLVQRGDQVRTLQPIGTVYTNPSTGEADLDFKIYKSKQAVDPQIWLAHL